VRYTEGIQKGILLSLEAIQTKLAELEKRIQELEKENNE
tara:strand:- start:719 stop:835 length:117 start_codon:yes stop_codon:yes gene_type:complete